MVDGQEEYELDTTDEEEGEESLLSIASPADVFLTGKAVRSEIRIKDLSPEEKEKFEASMAKEWSSWEKFNAVEVLTPDQVAQLQRMCASLAPAGFIPTRTRSKGCSPSTCGARPARQRSR